MRHDWHLAELWTVDRLQAEPPLRAAVKGCEGVSERRNRVALYARDGPRARAHGPPRSAALQSRDSKSNMSNRSPMAGMLFGT